MNFFRENIWRIDKHCDLYGVENNEITNQKWKIYESTS